MKGNITIDTDGSDIEYDYAYELGEKETRDDPSTDTSIEITAACMVLADKKNNMVIVDIIGILDLDVNYELIIETINEHIKEFHNNPPEDE